VPDQSDDRATKPTHLTVTEVAAHLNIGREKVRAWCATGKIAGALNLSDGPGARSCWRIPLAALEAFKASRQVRPPNPPVPRRRPFKFRILTDDRI
jgi:excisionase family DNA binding protein